MNITRWVLISVVVIGLVGGGWYALSPSDGTSPATDAMMQDDSMMGASDFPADSMTHEGTSTDAMMMSDASSTDVMMR